MNLLAAFTKRNILKLIATAFGVALATVLLLLFVKHAKAQSKSRELAAQAVSVLETDPELGFQLAARAARYKETDEAIAALRKHCHVPACWPKWLTAKVSFAVR